MDGEAPGPGPDGVDRCPHRRLARPWRSASRRRAGAVVLMAALLAGCGTTSTSAPAPGTPGASASGPASSATAATTPSATTSQASTAGPAGTPGATPARSPSASPVPTPAPTPTPLAADWPVYHGDAARTGFDATFPAPRHPARAWSTLLDGAVYGQPIVVGGRIIAATEGDSVYALDPRSGRIEWTRHVGTPVPLAGLPCGNIDPLGITSTPAYDPGSGSVFVVAEVRGPQHVLFALDPASGAVRWSRVVDLPGDDPRTHQQRAALAVASGFVYIGFGGLAGDCGQYRGEVVGVPTTGVGATIAYRVPVQREGAVWATGGPVIDAAGHLYVSTGNGSSTTTYDGSDSVVELTPRLALVSRFAPATWAADNANDADLGSLSPVIVPGGWIFIAGKSGTGYVLRQGALGGIGGQVSAAPVCRAFGAAARSGSIVYVPCTDGIRQVRIDAQGGIHIGWHTGSGADGPPVTGGGAVWGVDVAAGVLYALGSRDGAALARIGLGAVPHFASPTLWDGLVLVGTMRGVAGVRAAP